MNKETPYIFLDLDETLIHTICCASNNTNRVNIKLDDGWYSTMKRPFAKMIIHLCRALSHTKMLTNATQDYAFAINDKLDLGFDEGDILARYDYLDYIHDGFCGYGGGPRSTLVVNGCLELSNAILIDNLHPDAPGAIQKKQFLGIDDSRYIQIREFLGKDPDNFMDELNVIFNKVSELINN